MKPLERLNQLYASNRCARAVLDHFAANGDQAETTVEGLRDVIVAAGKACGRREVIAVLKKLQYIGLGWFVVGRRTHPSRFSPGAPLADIGNAARGSTAPARKPAPVPAAAEAPQPENEIIAHRYVLRRDFLLTVQLPADLTRVEAARIAEFIKSLPFG